MMLLLLEEHFGESLNTPCKFQQLKSKGLLFFWSMSSLKFWGDLSLYHPHFFQEKFTLFYTMSVTCSVRYYSNMPDRKKSWSSLEDVKISVVRSQKV